MKKGFTLIELLAVIIVLAIIALVATPIVLDVIKDSRDSAAKDSAYGVLHSAKYYYAEEYMKNNGVFTEYECSFNNRQGCDLLSISGDKPTIGSLLIDKDGKVNGKIQFDDYEFYICDSKVLESESSECSFIEYEKIYAINESGVITGFKMEGNISILDFIIPTVNASNLTKEAEEYIKDGKITIPEYINSIEVTGIGCSAFTNYNLNEITILSEKVITICEDSLPTTLTKLRVNSCLKDSYDLGVETEGIGTCEISTPIANYKCKRATDLHTEICNATSTANYCGRHGYSKGATITYGNDTVTEGTLKSGDAFDCDVNGDGTYDAKTERFYYVSDLYNTTTKEFEDKYAVLIYYTNTTKGIPDNTVTSKISYAWESNKVGPDKSKTNLPTIEQWKNVNLFKDTRTILNEGSSATVIGGTLPTAFSYSGYAARMLTRQEVFAYCSSPRSCEFLFENTKFSSGNVIGWWFETPKATNTNYVFVLESLFASYDTTYATNSSDYGVRPAIEVLKTDIEI